MGKKSKSSLHVYIPLTLTFLLSILLKIMMENEPMIHCINLMFLSNYLIYFLAIMKIQMKWHFPLWDLVIVMKILIE